MILVSDTFALKKSKNQELLHSTIKSLPNNSQISPPPNPRPKPQKTINDTPNRSYKAPASQVEPPSTKFSNFPKNKGSLKEDPNCTMAKSSIHEILNQTSINPNPNPSQSQKINFKSPIMITTSMNLKASRPQKKNDAESPGVTVGGTSMNFGYNKNDDSLKNQRQDPKSVSKNFVTKILKKYMASQNKNKSPLNVKRKSFNNNQLTKSMVKDVNGKSTLGKKNKSNGKKNIEIKDLRLGEKNCYRDNSGCQEDEIFPKGKN
jgi:hypothetical protein